VIEPETHTLRVEEAEAGQRLDAWLAERLPQHSRSAIKRHIGAGDVLIDGRPVVRASHSVKTGDCVTLTIPPAASPLPQPEEIEIDIVHEDDHLVVVNKPPGMVVHPARGHMEGTLVNALLHLCPDMRGVGGVRRPGIVHRLDKDTSGLLVAAKDDRTHRALSAALQRREIRRRYDALVWGERFDAPRTIDAPIARDPKNRLRMAVVKGGRDATTHLEMHRPGELISWLHLRLQTGRTHQIRVHLRHIGHPIVGDELYGGMGVEWIQRLHRRSSAAAAAVRRAPRSMLHAGLLAFEHPVTGERFAFEAAPPADFRGLATSIGL
jgi:23S rRNA pseudouridine1911/1915/1917 synthase